VDDGSEEEHVQNTLEAPAPRTGHRVVTPTGQERTFSADELIVSKTDPRGVITYANDVFLRVSGYPAGEALGRPHNIIRHPDMPKAVFALLWETLAARQEMFAYINNLAADGAHYWVLAHVTPSYGRNGDVIGYHSSRRCPPPGRWHRCSPSTSASSPRSAATRTPRRRSRRRPGCCRN
jgi:PAS domain S-box-containing protein